MYLSPDRLALANQAVIETFENTSVAWQVIPHWDTGDPTQTGVPDDDVNAAAPGVLPLVDQSEELVVTLATACGDSVDPLLNKVAAATGVLAAKVDEAVIWALRTKSANVTLDYSTPDTILDDLIDARATVEKEGFRAPSCLLTNTEGIKKLSQLSTGYGPSILNSLLDAANINSLHRVEVLENPKPPPKDPARAIMLGRRQRISHGGAADASPGEEPVDLAVSVPPSLELVGEKGDNKIAFTVRIRYALRVKDSGSLVTLQQP
jgi:hypothetical protein